MTCPTDQVPFQPVGAGHYYLADTDPSFRDGGTWLINSDLLRALKTKTTYPPQVQTSDITQNTTWSPTAHRDTTGGDTPDLGYHYEPLDRVVNAKSISTFLTLSGGVAVGTYGSLASYGLAITGTGSLVSEGTPANLNYIARYNTVQE